MIKKKQSKGMVLMLAGTVCAVALAVFLLTSCMGGGSAVQPSSQESAPASSETSSVEVSVPDIVVSSKASVPETASSSQAEVSSQTAVSKEQTSPTPEKKTEPVANKEQASSVDAKLEVKGDTQKQDPPASKPSTPSGPKDGDIKSENGVKYIYDSGLGEWIETDGLPPLTEQEASEGNDEFIANFICPFCGAGFGQCDCKNGY